ncbi:MAG: hypothetical protein SFY66_19630 [Oculatellaceae cyanobacterium bins.114]|nr:hypothetical protein [Oculatellaceae cyanobacterium bins.114]
MQSLTPKEIEALLELERTGKLTPELVYQRAALRQLQSQDNYVFSAIKHLAVGAVAVFFGGMGIAPIFAGLLAYNWYQTYNKRAESRRRIVAGDFVDLLDESDRKAYEEDSKHYQLSATVPVKAIAAPEPTAITPVVVSHPQPVQQPIVSTPTPAHAQQSQQPAVANPFDATVLDTPAEEVKEEKAVELRSPVDHLIGSRLRTSLIVSVSGGGKDIVLSNVLRQLIAQRPGFKFFVMDCKDDPKETAYYANLPNTTLYRKNLAIATWREAKDWIEGCLDEFLSVPEMAILICNEGTEVRTHSRRYVEAVNALVSTGDSRQKYVFEAGQSAHTDDLRVNGAARSRFRLLIIGLRGEEMQIEAVLAAKFVADSARNMADIKAKMDESPVSRCWCDGQHWYAMPSLENHSGYNRDTRSQVDNQPTASAFSLPDDAELFESTELQPKVSEGEPTIEESLLSWFSKRSGQKHKVRDIVMSKAKGLVGVSSEDLSVYLDLLVAEGKLTKQEDFYYQKLNSIG